MSGAPTISFLSDYGPGGAFVGVCHGVIARICPQARVIDIAHDIPRHDIRAGAVTLRNALRFMPVGVHIAVVDPGVGGERRALAVRSADGRILVGPDNGLLLPAAQQHGGIVEAIQIDDSPWRLQPLSATFHGRDLFAPVAAHLACGAPLAPAGQQLDPAALVDLELPASRRVAAPSGAGDALLVTALIVDDFGNVALGATGAELDGLLASHDRRDAPPAVALELRGERHVARRGGTFADVAPGELLIYEDSDGALALALNGGDAARSLGIAAGDELRIHPR